MSFSRQSIIVLVHIVILCAFIWTLHDKSSSILKANDLEYTNIAYTIYTESYVIDDIAETVYESLIAGNSSVTVDEFEFDPRHFYFPITKEEITDEFVQLIDLLDKHPLKRHGNRLGLISTTGGEIAYSQLPYDLDTLSPDRSLDRHCQTLDICINTIHKTKSSHYSIIYPEHANKNTAILLYKSLPNHDYIWLKVALNTAYHDIKVTLEEHNTQRFTMRFEQKTPSLFSLHRTTQFTRWGKLFTIKYEIPMGQFYEFSYLIYLALLLIPFMSFYIFSIQLGKTKIQLALARNKASTDKLTGALNADAWHSRVERPLKSNDYIVFYFDGNKVKHINDTYGHTIGDQAIRTLHLSLKSSFRDDDKIYRVGGDEFIVLSNGKMDPVTKLERINTHLSTTPILLNEHISVSSGYADGTECGSLGEVMKLAEKRMFENKSDERVS